MSQNLSRHHFDIKELRFKTVISLIVSVFIACLMVSILFDYVNQPLQEPLRRDLTSIENVEAEVIVNPLVIKKNIDTNIKVDKDEKLLNWDEFRQQRKLDKLIPDGFNSVLQREIRSIRGRGYVQIVEFSNNLDAVHFLWHFPGKLNNDLGFQYDDSLWTISGRFLQVSTNSVFTSKEGQVKLHKAIADNLGKSLLKLSKLKQAKNLDFVNLEWEKKSFEKTLRVELSNHVLHLADASIMKSFDSISYKVRNYALGDLELKRVVSMATNRTLIIKQMDDYVLISSKFPRKLNLSQKYELQRLFR